MPIKLCILEIIIIFTVKIVEKLILVIACMTKNYSGPEKLKCKEPYSIILPFM